MARVEIRGAGLRLTMQADDADAVTFVRGLNHGFETRGGVWLRGDIGVEEAEPEPSVRWFAAAATEVAVYFDDGEVADRLSDLTKLTTD